MRRVPLYGFYKKTPRSSAAFLRSGRRSAVAAAVAAVSAHAVERVLACVVGVGTGILLSAGAESAARGAAAAAVAVAAASVCDGEQVIERACKGAAAPAVALIARIAGIAHK